MLICPALLREMAQKKAFLFSNFYCLLHSTLPVVLYAFRRQRCLCSWGSHAALPCQTCCVWAMPFCVLARSPYLFHGQHAGPASGTLAALQYTALKQQLPPSLIQRDYFFSSGNSPLPHSLIHRLRPHHGVAEQGVRSILLRQCKKWATSRCKSVQATNIIRACNGPAQLPHLISHVLLLPEGTGVPI